MSSITTSAATNLSKKPIRNAGCLIIGDEILNGKILDTNSYHFARQCFNNLSIPLKRTIVCGDDPKDITKSLDILLKQDQIDFIITSGGLGSTHDDITYEVLSEYFGLDYCLDQEVVNRMHKVRGKYLDGLKTDQLQAFYKMATLPSAKKDNPISVEKYFIGDNLWFPLVALNEQVYILPGVPELFKKLIKEMQPLLKDRIRKQDLNRRYVKTTTKESELAPFLTKLQNKCDSIHGIGKVKLGSYPHFNWQVNTISIISNSLSIEDLQEIVDELVANLGGQAQEINQEQEDKFTNEEPPHKKH
ncbi:uncharacterized protein J8A68_006018 [[Candida] subhashii]|uniref:MoaB/Mog domain-containing protein n=1 Tax=[Candida] subhashii TaxID=561895 RepID=A0A8J5Q4R1_9ASCO|nr:uncharacterized protein J8A68_006018 [[Candida] subhashii]KAG7660471.1 hypothetical protein J8A68_006018 [[Candida] subhashii]